MICESLGNKSIVKMERIYFTKLSCERSGDILEEESLSVSFKRRYKFSENETRVRAYLNCGIKADKDGLLDVNVEICGEFICEDDDAQRRKTLLTKNTLSILFPYLRSQLSLLTTQPDMSPVIIPPMNIESFFESK